MSNVSLVNDGAALQSMRNSDFDAYSAIGEVIDNSIQALAKNINIRIDIAANRQYRGSEPITAIYFGDDGIGMTTDILHRCLQLGYSSRYNDRSGIGRFGVGATLAAINQCKKIELYSKTASGSWHHTFIDLDMVTANPPQMEAIPAPKPASLKSDLGTLVGTTQGTLVVWTKYDRQHVGGSELIDRLKIWVGRTYRKFIWKGLTIKVNGEKVRAVDPLYVTTKDTKFPDDPAAHEFAPMTFSWPIPIDERVPGGPTESTITIRMSLLPKEWRPTQGSGNSKVALERYVDENEGISIMRNDREVFYDRIPWWPGDPFKEIDRWWGCEVSFSAVLDSAFTVKNIKRGAVPVKELKKTIQDCITPTRNSALENVRELWKQAQAQAKVKDAELGIDTGHSDAEQAAKDTATPKNVFDKDKNFDKEAKTIIEDFFTGVDEQKRAQWHAKFKNQPFTILEDAWRGPEFIETNHLGGTDVLKYNNRHVFFQELEAIKEVLREDESELEYSRRLAALIDLLLISYSKAEAMFDRDLSVSAERFIEQLRMNWGHYLSSYITTWRQQSTQGERSE